MKNLQRESKNRSRSERLIDRQLTREDIQPEALKKLKVDENKAQISRLSSSEALEKIKKCLKQEEKIPKTIPILRNLLKKYSARITAEEAIFCAKQVFFADYSLFFPVDQLSDFVQDIQTFYQLQQNDENFLENAKFVSETFNQLFTDDSLKFHSKLRKIDEKLEETKEGSSIIQFFSLGLPLFKQVLKKPWARSSVLQVLQKFYRKREIFDPKTNDLVLQMIDLKFGFSSSGEVKGISEAGHQVVDNRELVYSVNSLDSWACKQSGLGESLRKT